MKNRNKLWLIAIITALIFGFIACDNNQSSNNEEIFGEITFTVTFDTAGGNPMPATQTVPEGGTATIPSPAPTKSGYHFDHWSLQGQTTAFNFASPITANITLIAQWHEERVFTEGETGQYGYFLWRFSNGTMTIIGYVGTDTDITIPSTIHSIAVTSIAGSMWLDGNLILGAFHDRQLTSVTIPDSVTYIGTSAFRDNQLTSIVIPDSVTTIRWSAFSNNPISNLVIGNGITSIPAFAFQGWSLTSVTIGNSVTSIGSWAFANNQLVSVTIGNSVTTIWNGVFSNNQLTSVIIPDSVTAIWERAFENNQLTSVTIGNSVTSIGAAQVGIVPGGAFENSQRPPA